MVEDQGSHLAADVGAREHGDDARHGQGLRGVDARDARVRHGAPDKRDLEGARQVEVGDIGAGAGDEGEILLARHALPDPGHDDGASISAIISAARSIAAKIFT